VKAENFTASPTDNKLVMQTVEEDNIPATGHERWGPKVEMGFSVALGISELS
jgi:hypothetical protein